MNILAAFDEVIKKFTETPVEKVTAKLEEVGKKGKKIKFQGKRAKCPHRYLRVGPPLRLVGRNLNAVI